MEDAREYLEMTRAKMKKVRRMEESLAEHVTKAETVTGLKIAEKVQTSNKATIDATLAAIEEEKKRLEEAQKELEDMLARAREMIDLIRDDETAWQILWERYIMGETWSAIAKQLGYSRRTIMRIRDEGIERIEEKLSHHVTSCHIKMC